MVKQARKMILHVIDDYMKDNCSTDIDLLKSVFHEKAVICGIWFIIS